MNVTVNAGNIVTNAIGVGNWNSVNIGSVKNSDADSHEANVSVGNVILNSVGVGQEAAVNVGSVIDE